MLATSFILLNTNHFLAWLSNIEGANGLKDSLNLIFLFIISLIFFPLGSAIIDLFPSDLAPHSSRPLNKPIIFFFLIFFTINSISS